MPSHKSSVTVSCRSASCIHRYSPALLRWFSSSYNHGALLLLLLEPHRRPTLLVFHGCLLGDRKNSNNTFTTRQTTRNRNITVENSLTLNLWNNQQQVLCWCELRNSPQLRVWFTGTLSLLIKLPGTPQLWKELCSVSGPKRSQSWTDSQRRNKELCQSSELKTNYWNIFFNSYASLTTDRLRLKIRRSSCWFLGADSVLLLITMMFKESGTSTALNY